VKFPDYSIRCRSRSTKSFSDVACFGALHFRNL